MATGKLIHLISSSLWGGREQYALDICRGFSARGWNVTAVTRDASAVNTPFTEAGIKVRHLPLGHYAGLSTVIRLAHLLRRGPYPISVHVHTFRDALLALIARKLVGHRRAQVLFTCHRVKPCRDTLLRRRILRNLHALIFPSALARDTFLSTWSPVELPLPDSKIHVLHNGVYLPGIETDRPTPSGPVTASYYGRIVNGKGLETFICALPALRGMRTRACIAGSGDPDYIDSLKRLATRLGVMEMIDWRGNSLSRQAIMERTHIGVFPSLVAEAFGQGNAACMAYGRPQISTFNGAQCEYLTHGVEALMVPPADTEALTNALKRLVSDADLRATMGKAARSRYMRDLSWERYASQLEQLYS